MSARVKGRVTAVGSVLLAAVLAAGCSGKSSTPAASRPTPTRAPHLATTAPSKVVLASVQTTAAAKSARVAMSIDTSGLAGFSLSGDGLVDFANGDSQLSMRLGGQEASLLPGGLEMRSVNHVVYVQLPGATGDPHWVEVDAGNLGSSSASVPGLGQSDPRQFLASLETISDNVTNVGSEVVRGVETTHYRATLDLAKSLDKASIPPALRDAEKQFLGTIGKGAPVMPVDVFIDADGYVRRISLGLDLGSFGALLGGSGGTGPAFGMVVSIDLYDFGTPVNVQAPPADQVSHEPLLGGMDGSGGLGGLDGSGSSSPSSSSPGHVSSAV